MAMESSKSSSALAREAAERILSAIFGPDLAGCKVTPDMIAPILQEVLDAQTERERTVNGLLVQVLEQMKTIATPPDKSQVKDTAHLITILRERMDGIHVLSTETLNAWRKLNAG